MKIDRLVLIIISVAVTGCARKPEAVRIPQGPLSIYYTSVRGAAPHIVDSFVIISDPSVSPSYDSGDKCFFVPPTIDPFFRKALKELLAKYQWDQFESPTRIDADSPFRRLAIEGSGYLKFVELHEGVPPPDFVGTEEFKRFYALVSDIRIMGEIYGVQTRVVGHPIFEKLGGPLIGAGGGNKGVRGEAKE